MDDQSSHRRSPSVRVPRWTLLALAGGTVAAAVLTAALVWRARLPGVHFQRASRALDAGEFDLVQRELRHLEGTAGFEPHCHFLRGALLVQAGKLYPALDEFGHSVVHPDLRLRTLLWSGRALYQLGRYHEARGLLLQVVETDPEAVEAHRLLASACDYLGLRDDAITHLRRIAELAPADPGPHRMMGLILKDFEDYPAAIESYRESLRRNPRQPDREELLLELAECQLKQRDHEAALTTLSECRPSADRWAAEAECHYLGRRLEQAEGLLDEALRQSPAHLAALLLKGTIAMDRGRQGEAVEVLSRAAVAYPKEYTVQYRLARALQQAGDAERGREHAQAADQIRRLRAEFSKLHATAAAAPNDAAVRCRLGLLARQLERPDLARIWFRAALAVDPGCEEARRNLHGVPHSGKPPD